MMMPIALALVRQLEHRSGARLAHFGAALMLAVAYAANVGGLGTKIGTAPNAMLAGFLAQRGVELGFLEFAAVGTGFVLLFLPLVALVLWRIARRDAPRADLGRAVLDEELAALGPLRAGERAVLAVFLAAAALWILGAPLVDLLRPRVLAATGLALGAAHFEAGVALLAALCLAAWRARGRAVLELRSLRFVSWPALLLLGGGFAMAEGVQRSGLSGWMASLLAAGAGLPALVQLLLATGMTVALSAVASNTATIAVMLTVLAEAAAPEHATSVLFAAALACSCDFMLPAGTPPNAIVFGSGYLTVRRMAGAGIALDLAAALLVALWCAFAVPAVL
jgi:sodium-dependent dicarboxylate transporter 2/3/5